jgi:hypothetical protein
MGMVLGVGGGGGQGYGTVNIVQIPCTHVCNWENEICCNYSMNGGRRNKGECWKGDFKYDIFNIL